MASVDSDKTLPDHASGRSLHTPSSSVHETTPTLETPNPTVSMNGSIASPKAEKPLPSTPSRVSAKHERTNPQAVSPRFKKKIAWNGKNIMVSLPRDERRGQLGQSPMPLNETEVSRMVRSWEELGYDTKGFDLNWMDTISADDDHSKSRDAWPSAEELNDEKAARNYRVVLPDLNAWKSYVDELNEAKLRALGVSFGDEDPPPSVSPATSMSRQASITKYPPPTFSPPLPTSSASSNHAQFPFPVPFAPVGVPSGTQSPGIPTVPSPASFAKYNPHASISIPSSMSPFGWTRQENRSPMDQFQVPALHQRHQSLQYPIGTPQLPHGARASPRLGDVREIDEDDLQKNSSETPEPSQAPLIRHNASASLQKEIDEAEYHLEEQFRSQLEHDEDYSPHNEEERAASLAAPKPEISHAEESSVKFTAAQLPSFADDSDRSPVLHHPQPHNRGHSLSQKYFAEQDEVRDSTDEAPFSKPLPPDTEAEVGLNRAITFPSSFEPSVQPFNFGNSLHQSFFPSTNNPSSGILPQSGPVPYQFPIRAATMDSGPNEAAAPRGNVALSKFNANAPAFSPGQSEFSFSSAGPKFRPDAPAFTPFHSLSGSLTSPVSGSDSAGNRTSSIFGNIDLSIPDIIKPVKKSKAIPIVRPASRESAKPDGVTHEGPDGRLVDDPSRVKRQRGRTEGDDEVALFATQPMSPEPRESVNAPDTQTGEPAEVNEQVENEEVADEEVVDDKLDDDDNVAPADTTLSSTMVSDATDAKDSPLQTSPDQHGMNWAPFEFHNPAEIQSFNDARPFGDGLFKRHKKTLSAAAKPFVPGLPPLDKADEFVDLDDEEGLMEPKAPYIPSDSNLSDAFKAPKPRGLAASRFAVDEPAPASKPMEFSSSRSGNEETRTPERAEEEQPQVSPLEHDVTTDSPPTAEIQRRVSVEEQDPFRVPQMDAGPGHEPTYDEIDAIMRHLDENPMMGVKKTVAIPQWHQPSPTRPISVSAFTNLSSMRPPQPSLFRSDPPSPSPGQYRQLPELLPTTEMEDPFGDPPASARSVDGAAHRVNMSDSIPPSDWEGAFSDDEQAKLQSRVNFFDGHVNELVGGLLASHFEPLKESIIELKRELAVKSRRTPSSRRDRRSMSAEVHKSDADDEDDDVPVPRRSMSPRKDRRMEQIRAAVLEAMSAQQATKAQPVSIDNTAVLQALEDMREQFGQSLHLDFRGEDLRNIVEDAVERRMPATPKPVLDDGLNAKVGELQARVVELEQRLRLEETRNETEINSRRVAEDKAAELQRRLELAETRVEIEIMNKSAFDQRVADLEDRLKHEAEEIQEESHRRRAAEDRLSEVQRLLRISSEEETRLREVTEKRDEKIKALEEMNGKMKMRMAVVEAAQDNGSRNQSDLQNRINIAEVDLRDARQELRHWKGEAEAAGDLARRQSDDLAQALEENKRLTKITDTLRTQLKETERVREGWRVKFHSLEQDMAQASREIAEENATRAKKEQALIARHEVLDAKLQAEARTRERLETEIERLEGGERQGMRAVNECKRLETTVSDLRTENHKLQQTALRYQAEFQEARESGAREVQRTRESLQTEVDDANHQVNVVREELEDQISKLQAQLDQAKVDADTARARQDMFLEEVENTKRTEVELLARKHQNEIEDLQTRYERQISNTSEDAQRAEQNLLERLSISSSKSEQLQSRVAHLEEKLEIAQEAAKAAAQAAKSAAIIEPTQSIASKPIPRSMQLPEKISPQALRESIMVLQEQLQEREQRIEQLQQTLSKLDPDASTKIAKRDDEIIWLRELLAVRHSDLQDIIAALGREDYDREAVKDAAIRLNANLQMEEQERERAMNGGSAITLPNIAATIRNAASPRVAQAVGPLAAALGNWRKSRDPAAFGSLSSVLSTTTSAGSGSNATPAKSSPASQSSFLSGMLTPPSSGLRRTPPEQSAVGPSQPAAFSNTVRRYTGQQQAATDRPRGTSTSSRHSEKMPVRDTPPRKQGRGDPFTPLMMRSSAYDSDAHAAEFDDAASFDDE